MDKTLSDVFAWLRDGQDDVFLLGDDEGCRVFRPTQVVLFFGAPQGAAGFAPVPGLFLDDETLRELARRVTDGSLRVVAREEFDASEPYRRTLAAARVHLPDGEAAG